MLHRQCYDLWSDGVWLPVFHKCTLFEQIEVKIVDRLVLFGTPVGDIPL